MSLTTEQRRQGIGASEVSTILGVNPWKTPEQLRLEKLGRIKNDVGNDNTDFGHLLEHVIAEKAAEKLGVKIRRQNHPIFHSKHKFLFGHIDRRIVGKREGLEIKNANWWMRRDWGEQETDDIPMYYLPQAHTYMLLLDFTKWNVAVYFGGSDLRLYTVERDKEMDKIILNSVLNFWKNHVLNDTPCPVDWSTPGSDALLKKLYPDTDGTFRRFGFDEMALVENMQTLSDQISELKKQLGTIKRRLLGKIGPASGCVFPDGSGLARKKIFKQAHHVDASNYYALKQEKNLQIKLDIWGV